MYIASLLPVFGLVAVASSYATPNFQDECAALADSINLDIPFTVNIAEYLPPNATIDYATEGLNETCLGYGLVAPPIPVGVCRLNLKVETTNRSETYMELWMPEKWGGRILTAGNGGLAGCVQYPEVAYGASYGFATVGTNAGHNGTSGGAFYQQPDVLEDFVWRSVYTGTQIGKSITRQFYRSDLGKSYYIGCSMGGRQGWQAVQKNPELFDGLIAGAPAIDSLAHVSFFGYVYETLGFTANESIITIEQWAAVQAEALQQCDELDGAHDGILEDPSACQLDWKPLLCSGNSPSTCLTSTQVEAAARLFAPITYNGTLLHPGQNHGFESSLIMALYSDLVTTWLPEFFRYMIYSDLSWDPTSFTLADAANAFQLNPFDINTFNADISAFRDRGGKILHWHGGADPLLASTVSDLYYSKVQSTLNASVADLDKFYRYFHASGVGHCSGGPGASFMGQGGQLAASADPDDNMLTRIVEWVEHGNAPEFVRGTKFVNDTVSLGVEFTRKHCKYPKVNHYTGTGNGTDEEGWECVEP